MSLPAVTPRLQAIRLAQQIIKEDPLYLDTETTGLERQDEIVEISVADDQGLILFESLVKPSQPIPAVTTRIHGINQDMVQKAPAWPVVWHQLRPMLANRLIVTYNAEFDKRMIEQSHSRYRMVVRDELKFIDLMKIYAQFRGEWDFNRRSWKYQSLDAAGKQCEIALPNAHRATADTLLTHALLHFISQA